MLLISHRGNIDGPDPLNENRPGHIVAALYMDFNVEVDVWWMEDGIYLGHDSPVYKTDHNFLINKHLWIHCKNIDAMINLSYDDRLNLFYHKEGITFSSKGFLMTAPGLSVNHKSIALMPEMCFDWDVSPAYGICTDYPLKHRDATTIRQY